MTSDRVLGFSLIGIGGVLLLGAMTDLGGEMVPGVVGLVFLANYARTRTYGLLIPGGILTGLGAGLILAGQGVPGEVVPLGLGLGFLAIALVSRLVHEGLPGWWWPLIPGGILTLVGTTTLAATWRAGHYLVPTALIVLGAALLSRRPRGPQAVDEESHDHAARC